jgi:hypothetical protein
MILIKKHKKFSLLRSTRLEKAQNKQAAFMVALSCMREYLVGLVGIHHH